MSAGGDGGGADTEVSVEFEDAVGVEVAVSVRVKLGVEEAGVSRISPELEAKLSLNTIVVVAEMSAVDDAVLVEISAVPD